MAIGGLTALTATDANAQATDTENALIGAVISNPLALTKTGDLNFGEIAPSIGATFVKVNPDGSVDGTTDATMVNIAAVTAAQFDVTGLAGATYSILLPGVGSTLLTGPVGSTDMAVEGFTATAGAGTLDGAGTESFGVGATLTINADQMAGSYSGNFDVTVSYN